MDKKRKVMQVLTWWRALETEADNEKMIKIHNEGPRVKESDNGVVIGSVIEDDEGDDEPAKVKNCFVIKQAIQRLHQFLVASHLNGCAQQKCKYNSKVYSLKIRVRRVHGSLLESRAHKKN